MEHENAIGSVIGNYKILEEIGRGFHSYVYKCEHILYREIVAVKTFTELETRKQEEFRKEALLLRQLNHPHILKIIDAGFDQENHTYLVLEYADGGTLRQRIKERQQSGQVFPLGEALKIIYQIGLALQYIHTLTDTHALSALPMIVHRDLKPENILFNKAGDALLADFGIAVVLDLDGTLTVGAEGTIPYMAPEQLRGKASPKSDQYALGCIAYELLTGQRRFDAVDYETPLTYLPANIKRAILKALSEYRQDRYPDVAAFVEDIASLLFIPTAPAPPSPSAFETFQPVPFEAPQRDVQLETLQPASFEASPEDASELLYQEISTEAHNLNNRGEALRDEGDEERALETFNAALGLAPHFVAAHINRGLSLELLRHHEAALRAYEQAIHFDPENVIAYYYKSVVLEKLGRRKEAEEALREVHRRTEQPE